MKFYKILIYSTLMILFSFNSNAQTDLDHKKITEDLIQGKFEFELYFAEWGGRMKNGSCDVIIEGNKITVLQNEKTNLTGEKKLAEGFLLKHKSGRWIIAKEDSDINAEEIGGCSGGPIPINLEEMIIEWC